MARPRTFDPDTALDAAIQVFWRQGYEGTSVDDLVRVTGVNRYSLYSLWDDKRGLYIAALERYGRTLGGAWILALEAGRLAAIHAHFHTLAEAIIGDPERRGCFTVNTSTELGARDLGMRRQVRENLDRVEHAFARALANAVAARELPPGFPVEAHARHLAVTMQGLLLQARNGAPEATLRDFVRIALSTLPEPSP